MAMQTHFEAVIFDFDYTLADSSPGEIECVNYALRSMGCAAADEAAIRSTIGRPLPDTFCALTGQDAARSGEFTRLFVERADQVMLDHITLFDSVKPAVARLLESGLALAIASTKYRYRIQAFLARESLSSAFPVVVGGEDVKAHKPDPEALVLALNKLECPPSRALYVGDSIVDAEASARAGMAFVAVLTGVTAREAFSAYSPLAVVRDLTLLPDLVTHKP